jgi:hypothetical protein
VILLAPLLERVRAAAPWKLAAGTMIGVAAAALAVLAAGVLVAWPSDSGPGPAVLATVAPSPTPELLPDELPARVIGPYYIAPARDGPPPQDGYVPANAGLPAAPPAANLEEARQSPLFPAALPEGYTPISGHSQGQSAAAYLQLTLEGPAGQVTVALSRPSVLPIWVAHDDAWGDGIEFLGRDSSGLPPGPGSGEPAIVHAFYHGVAVAVSLRTADIVALADLARALLPSRFDRPGEYRLAPELPPDSERLPRAQDVTSSGPCTITPSMTTDFVYDGARVALLAALDCTGLVPFSACPATYAGPIDGLDVACDDRGYRIDAHWEASIGDGATCRGGHPMVIYDGSMAGAMDCEGPANVGTGGVVPVEACVSVRDQESCASFEYVIP